MADKPTKSFSNIQEKKVAKELGGYQVGLSGAGPANPGDVRTYDWLIECKTHTTPGKKIAFNAAVWKKIQDEAMAMHKKPVLVVDDGSQSIKKTWCLCRAANINLPSATITASLPVQVKTNISCDHTKLADGLKAIAKSLISSTSFYQHAVYSLTWCDTEVLVMPFNTFKELFER